MSDLTSVTPPTIPPEPTTTTPTPKTSEPMANKETTAKTPAPAAAETLTKNEKFLSALGYLPLFFLVPLLVKRDSPFCQYHAKQGLVLTLMFLVLGILGFNQTLENIIGFMQLLAIGFFGFIAIKGQKKEVPMVSEMARSEYLNF